MLAADFEITVDGKPITPEDRDLAKRCRYLWVFGPTAYQDQIIALVPGAQKVRKHDGVTADGRQVYGWIGSATTSTDLHRTDRDPPARLRLATGTL